MSVSQSETYCTALGGPEDSCLPLEADLFGF